MSVDTLLAHLADMKQPGPRRWIARFSPTGPTKARLTNRGANR